MSASSSPVITVPLFAAPPALADDALGVRAWFIDPVATVVTQVTATAMTVPIALYLRDTVYPEALTRYVRQGRPCRFLHDWCALERYEADARDVLVQWGHASLQDGTEVVLALGSSAPALLRFTAATGLALLRMMGNEIRLVDDLGPLLAPLAAHLR